MVMIATVTHRVAKLARGREALRLAKMLLTHTRRISNFGKTNPTANYHGDRTMVTGIGFVDENGGGPGGPLRKHQLPEKLK
jgi:hypothetical protein